MYRSLHFNLGGDLPNMFGKALKGTFLQMLKLCEESHARSVARQMGVDLKDIRFVQEGDQVWGDFISVDNTNQLYTWYKVKALITAPNASQEDINMLGVRVQQECPMAKMNSASRTFHVEWKKA